MVSTLQVLRVQFFDTDPITFTDGRNAHPGEDGGAWYLVLTPCACKVPCEIACDTHPHDHHTYYLQPFRRGGVGHKPGATPQEIAENRANIWGWDGNRDAPTLNPSFLVPGDEHRPRIHLFLRAGRIDLCGDSSVVLHANPAPCKHEGEGLP